MKNKFQSGFTMVEIIVVILIISAMASMAFVNLSFVIEKTRIGEGLQMLATIRKAQLAYFYETTPPSFATTVDQLDVTFGTPKNFQVPVDVDILDPNADLNALMGIVIRNGNAYNLQIDLNGDITCNPVGGGDECTKAQIPVLIP